MARVAIVLPLQVRGVTSFIVTAGDKARGRRSGDTGRACMWILYWERAFLSVDFDIIM